MNTSVSWIHEYFWILDTWILLYHGYMNTSVSWIHEYFCILDTWILLYHGYKKTSVSWMHEYFCFLDMWIPLYPVSIFKELSLYPGYMNTSGFCIHILGSITVSWIREHLCILYLYFRKYHSILDTWMPLYSVTIFWEVSLYPGYMNTSVFCIHILGSIIVSWIHEHLCILYPYFRKYHCILDTWTPLHSVSIF